MRNRLLALLACLLVTACGQQQSPQGGEMPAVPVLAAVPEIRDVPIHVQAIGTLHPSVFIEIRPQVSGTLSKVMVAEGQWVKKGAPLLSINPKPYAVKVQEAEAQVAIDKAALDSIQKKLERFKTLADKDIISKLEWDELETEEAKARATLDADRARLEGAKLDLERCVAVSPIDGRVGKLDAHPGQLYTSGQAAPLATIAKMDPLIVEFAATEKEFASMQKNSKSIEIYPLCSPESCATGTITFIDNHFDGKTGLILIRGKVSNPDHKLRPGQSLKVLVPVGMEPKAMLIPQKAVKQNQNGPFVYVVQPDGTVGFRQVTLGREQGQDVMILEGLAPEEPVITDGHLRLSPGLKVEIKR